MCSVALERWCSFRWHTAPHKIFQCNMHSVFLVVTLNLSPRGSSYPIFPQRVLASVSFPSIGHLLLFHFSPQGAHSCCQQSHGNALTSREGSFDASSQRRMASLWSYRASFSNAAIAPPLPRHLYTRVSDSVRYGSWRSALFYSSKYTLEDCSLVVKRMNPRPCNYLSPTCVSTWCGPLNANWVRGLLTDR